MSKTFKRLSQLIVLTMLFSIVMPFTQTASAETNGVTDLTIHKITGNEVRETTFEELTGSAAPDGEPISNITFTYWSVTAEQLATMKSDPGSYDSVEKASKYLGVEGTATSPTDASGKTTVSGLVEGFYWFVENGSTAVKESHAVPFGLALPLTNEAGTGFIGNLHVYPKNILEDTPTVDKDVEEEGTKEASFNIGDSFNWIIKPSIVKGIEEYKTFIVTDKLDSQLTYKSLSVELNGMTMEEGTDYTLEVDGQNVKVMFEQAGLNKLANAGVDGQLRIYLEAVINDTAVIGKDIENNAMLEFDNNHGVTGEVDVDTPPTVATGGKKFMKVNASEEALKDAEFVIKNSAGEYLAENLTWVADKSQAKVLVSDDTGAFEITGLAYGEYTLVETKAPGGYALPTTPETSFTVDANSYWADPTALELVAADAMNILNKKQDLPMTGGTGTVIFTVVGLLLMFAAFMMLRRRNMAE
ncbi:SpaH/EbpB family LPXTG-anchored major pilin [Phocicoccus pinnipedialis]|uniref:Fimbrial subunit type 1 n=1 Tax=Phocicoccus pinnipedialis TaxID=110845 RepID=A0A6V7R3T9_9BACL|nr:SpaH/EbpB family LPXTG-anchored major pilin [Jeotgalicoccus pinnipedialis]MBP1940021.1 fimbrial isopeptide formation D2 family protein/LPXTG-motif cell wall-anchored protein [Jeotgalicoccus pinnipedialis]CAD2072031.1 Fimbrial subunit type 1 [Jeotgalicoccus pinnipedialis]